MSRFEPNFTDADVARAIAPQVQQLADEVAEAAARRAPHRTGFLASAIRVIDATANGNEVRARIRDDAKYAAFQETGYHDRGGTYRPGRYYLAGAAVEVAARHDS